MCLRYIATMSRVADLSAIHESTKLPLDLCKLIKEYTDETRVAVVENNGRPVWLNIPHAPNERQIEPGLLMCTHRCSCRNPKSRVFIAMPRQYARYSGRYSEAFYRTRSWILLTTHYIYNQTTTLFNTPLASWCSQFINTLYQRSCVRLVLHGLCAGWVQHSFYRAWLQSQLYAACG